MKPPGIVRDRSGGIKGGIPRDSTGRSEAPLPGRAGQGAVQPALTGPCGGYSLSIPSMRSDACGVFSMEAVVKSRIVTRVKAIALGVLLVLFMSAPAFAHGGYYRGGYGYGPGAAALGGLIAGTIIGGALLAPRYAPAPVYYAPPPVYYAPPPVYYAYPPGYVPPPGYYAYPPGYVVPRY